MSSKPHDTATAEKTSPSPHPDGLATSSTNYCPHCGAPLDKSLAQHMAQDCDPSEYDPSRAGRQASPEPADLPEPPLLEEAPDTIGVDEDELEERRDLADRLTKEGVLP